MMQTIIIDRMTRSDPPGSAELYTIEHVKEFSPNDQSI